MLLGLEAVLVSDEGDSVCQAVGSDVLVAAGDFQSLVVVADLLQGTLLLARGAVTCLEAVVEKSGL